MFVLCLVTCKSDSETGAPSSFAGAEVCRYFSTWRREWPRKWGCIRWCRERGRDWRPGRGNPWCPYGDTRTCCGGLWDLGLFWCADGDRRRGGGGDCCDWRCRDHGGNHDWDLRQIIEKIFRGIPNFDTLKKKLHYKNVKKYYKIL